MGKTSVATAIVNSETVKERFAHNRYWVSCISANSPSNFLSILCQSLSMKGQIKDTEDIRSITQAVREDNKPHLIVLDNFETTWHPVEGRQRTIQDILEALDALPNIAILVTMRSELPPIPHWKHEKLPNLQSEDSRRIYAAIDEECEGTPEELNELLKALGHLPYAVTLMATRAKASYASPAQLLEEWNEAGPTMISTTEDGMDHSIRLSVNSKFVRDSAGALRLLQVLSMLPEGVDRRELSIWIKDSKTEALDTLRKAALVQTSTTVVDGARKVHLFVLPVVQSYMAQGDRIPKSVREQVHKACFDFLSDHKDAMETPDNKGFRDAFAAIYSQEANLHSLLVSIVKTELEKEASDDSASSSRQSATSNNQPIHVPLITYVWFLRWSKPKSEIMKNILRLAKETNDVRSEAEITKALKEVLGGWGNRKTNMRTATEQFESLGDYRKAVVTDFRSIRYHNWQMRDEKATNRTGTILAKLEDARKKWEAREAYRKDSCIKALVLYYCSSIWLFFPKRCPEFIDDLLEAKKIFTRLDMQYHAGLCASHLAKRYLYLERDEDALKGNEEALESFKAVAFGESGMAEDIGDAYFWKAKILKRLDQWDNPDLIEALESALKIYRDVLGFHGKTGRMWEELGEINVQRKEWKEARAAYQTACEFGERAGLVRLKTQKRMPRWQNNIKYINAKEANPADDSVEFKPPPRVS